MHFTLATFLALGCRCVLSNPTSTVHVSLPSSVANGSRPIDRSFPGFGFATQDLVNYVGSPGKPNTFSLNLIQSVFNRTNGTPILRIGGTDGDAKTLFVPDGNHTGQKNGTNYLYSPVYFESFRNFLPHVKYIFQVPFRPGLVDNTVDYFLAGFKQIGAENLESVAIGNEEGQNYTRNGEHGLVVNYTGYVDQYLTYENAITNQDVVPRSLGFEIADGASRERGWDIFNPSGMFKNGINNNSRVNAVAYHLYQFNGDDLQSVLMDHTAMLRKLQNYTSQIAYMRKNHPDIPYVLSEIGNGEEGHSAGRWIQLTFGAALWQANIQLYCAAIGVARMNFISSGSSGHNTWSESPQRDVRPAFYDFIGNSTQDTTSTVLLNNTFMTGYAAFDGAELQRIALVNFELWPKHNTTAGFNSSRPSKAINLDGLPTGVKQVQIRRLTSMYGGFANKASDVEYDNTQWTVESNGRGVPMGGSLETAGVRNRSMTVEVKDSEAILITLER